VNAPVRTCVGCRQRVELTPECGLVRFVMVDGVLTRDDQRRLLGRGAWVHEECLDLAERRGAFRRALAGRVGAPSPA